MKTWTRTIVRWLRKWTLPILVSLGVVLLSHYLLTPAPAYAIACLQTTQAAQVTVPLSSVPALLDQIERDCGQLLWMEFARLSADPEFRDVIVVYRVPLQE